MSPPHEPQERQDSADHDPRLINYLLGLLPDEEAEPLDEASVADDQFAWRIRASENDLVDAYVSGTLPADTRQQFERAYLTSPRRREKVRIAQGLHAATSRAAEPDDADQTPSVTVARFGAGAGAGARPNDAAKAGPSTEAPSGRLSSRSVTPAPSSTASGIASAHQASSVSWGCVAAAVMLLVMAGALVFQQFWLRDAIHVSYADRAAFEQRTLELERLLGDQRAAQAETSLELTRVRAALAAARPPAVAATSASAPAVGVSPPRVIAASILLRPQTRGAGDVPTLAIRSADDGLPVTLLLEARWFVRYRATLTDPATGTAVWRSRAMTTASLAKSPVVPLVIPTRLLRAQHYSLDLSGLGAGGAEPVGSYTFRVVRP